MDARGRDSGHVDDDDDEWEIEDAYASDKEEMAHNVACLPPTAVFNGGDMILLDEVDDADSDYNDSDSDAISPNSDIYDRSEVFAEDNKVPGNAAIVNRQAGNIDVDVHQICSPVTDAEQAPAMIAVHGASSDPQSNVPKESFPQACWSSDEEEEETCDNDKSGLELNNDKETSETSAKETLSETSTLVEDVERSANTEVPASTPFDAPEITEAMPNSVQPCPDGDQSQTSNDDQQQVTAPKSPTLVQAVPVENETSESVADALDSNPKNSTSTLSESENQAILRAVSTPAVYPEVGQKPYSAEYVPDNIGSLSITQNDADSAVDAVCLMATGTACETTPQSVNFQHNDNLPHNEPQLTQNLVPGYIADTGPSTSTSMDYPAANDVTKNPNSISVMNEIENNSESEPLELPVNKLTEPVDNNLELSDNSALDTVCLMETETACETTSQSINFQHDDNLPHNEPQSTQNLDPVYIADTDTSTSTTMDYPAENDVTKTQDSISVMNEIEKNESESLELPVNKLTEPVDNNLELSDNSALDAVCIMETETACETTSQSVNFQHDDNLPHNEPQSTQNLDPGYIADTDISTSTTMDYPAENDVTKTQDSISVMNEIENNESEPLELPVNITTERVDNNLELSETDDTSDQGEAEVTDFMPVATNLAADLEAELNVTKNNGLSTLDSEVIHEIPKLITTPTEVLVSTMGTANNEVLSGTDLNSNGDEISCVEESLQSWIELDTDANDTVEVIDAAEVLGNMDSEVDTEENDTDENSMCSFQGFEDDESRDATKEANVVNTTDQRVVEEFVETDAVENDASRQAATDNMMEVEQVGDVDISNATVAVSENLLPGLAAYEDAESESPGSKTEMQNDLARENDDSPHEVDQSKTECSIEQEHIAIDTDERVTPEVGQISEESDSNDAGNISDTRVEDGTDDSKSTSNDAQTDAKHDDVDPGAMERDKLVADFDNTSSDVTSDVPPEHDVEPIADDGSVATSSQGIDSQKEDVVATKDVEDQLDGGQDPTDVSILSSEDDSTVVTRVIDTVTSQPPSIVDVTDSVSNEIQLISETETNAANEHGDLTTEVAEECGDALNLSEVAVVSEVTEQSTCDTNSMEHEPDAQAILTESDDVIVIDSDYTVVDVSTDSIILLPAEHVAEASNDISLDKPSDTAVLIEADNSELEQADDASITKSIATSQESEATYDNSQTKAVDQLGTESEHGDVGSDNDEEYVELDLSEERHEDTLVTVSSTSDNECGDGDDSMLDLLLCDSVTDLNDADLQEPLTMPEPKQRSRSPVQPDEKLVPMIERLLKTMIGEVEDYETLLDRHGAGAKHADPRRSVVVKRLMRQFSGITLKDHFSKFGTVSEVRRSFDKVSALIVYRYEEGLLYLCHPDNEKEWNINGFRYDIRRRLVGQHHLIATLAGAYLWDPTLPEDNFARRMNERKLDRAYRDLVPEFRNIDGFAACKKTSRGARITFNCRSALETAMSKPHPLVVNGHKWILQRQPPIECLDDVDKRITKFISILGDFAKGRFPPNRALWDYFESYGTIASVRGGPSEMNKAWRQPVVAAPGTRNLTVDFRHGCCVILFKEYDAVDKLLSRFTSCILNGHRLSFRRTFDHKDSVSILKSLAIRTKQLDVIEHRRLTAEAEWNAFQQTVSFAEDVTLSDDKSDFWDSDPKTKKDKKKADKIKSEKNEPIKPLIASGVPAPGPPDGKTYSAILTKANKQLTLADQLKEFRSKTGADESTDAAPSTAEWFQAPNQALDILIPQTEERATKKAGQTSGTGGGSKVAVVDDRRNSKSPKGGKFRDASRGELKKVRVSGSRWEEEIFVIEEDIVAMPKRPGYRELARGGKRAKVVDRATPQTGRPDDDRYAVYDEEELKSNCSDSTSSIGTVESKSNYRDLSSGGSARRKAEESQTRQPARFRDLSTPKWPSRKDDSKADKGGAKKDTTSSVPAKNRAVLPGSSPPVSKASTAAAKSTVSISKKAEAGASTFTISREKLREAEDRASTQTSSKFKQTSSSSFDVDLTQSPKYGRKRGFTDTISPPDSTKRGKFAPQPNRRYRDLTAPGSRGMPGADANYTPQQQNNPYAQPYNTESYAPGWQEPANQGYNSGPVASPMMPTPPGGTMTQFSSYQVQPPPPGVQAPVQGGYVVGAPQINNMQMQQPHVAPVPPPVPGPFDVVPPATMNAYSTGANRTPVAPLNQSIPVIVNQTVQSAAGPLPESAPPLPPLPSEPPKKTSQSRKQEWLTTLQEKMDKQHKTLKDEHAQQHTKTGARASKESKSSDKEFWKDVKPKRSSDKKPAPVPAPHTTAATREKYSNEATTALKKQIHINLQMSKESPSGSSQRSKSVRRREQEKLEQQQQKQQQCSEIPETSRRASRFHAPPNTDWEGDMELASDDEPITTWPLQKTTTTSVQKTTSQRGRPGESSNKRELLNLSRRGDEPGRPSAAEISSSDSRGVTRLLETMIAEKDVISTDNVTSDEIVGLLLAAKVSQNTVDDLVRENLVDPTILASVTSEDIRELKISIGDRKRIGLIVNLLGGKF